MKLSIVIVNFNGKHFFDACLASIVQHVPFEHEVIVVDNASTDGSVEYLVRHYPNVRLIASSSNLGFSKGNNLGAMQARGRFLLLLNNDTVIVDDITEALELMESDSGIGILSIQMLGRDKKYRNSVGYFPRPWRLVKFSSLYKTNGYFYDGSFPNKDILHAVEWVEGSFLLTPLELWERLAGLDESYFMYVEDVDYARRVFDVGLRTVYLPKISYVHFGGYGQSRISQLVSGFRRYHRAHSNWIERMLANVILDLGLVVRAAIYSLLSFFNKNQLQRAASCIRALLESR